MFRLPPNRDPQLEARYGRRSPGDYAGSFIFGLLGVILFIAILGVAIRLA